MDSLVNNLRLDCMIICSGITNICVLPLNCYFYYGNIDNFVSGGNCGLPVSMWVVLMVYVCFITIQRKIKHTFPFEHRWHHTLNTS